MTDSLMIHAVRTLRKKKGLSARSVSISAGLSPTYVFKLESGSIEPSFRNFARIAVVLDMTKSEFWLCALSESS